MVGVASGPPLRVSAFMRHNSSHRTARSFHLRFGVCSLCFSRSHKTAVRTRPPPPHSPAHARLAEAHGNKRLDDAQGRGWRKSTPFQIATKKAEHILGIHASPPPHGISTLPIAQPRHRKREKAGEIEGRATYLAAQLHVSPLAGLVTGIKEGHI